MAPQSTAVVLMSAVVMVMADPLWTPDGTQFKPEIVDLNNASSTNNTTPTPNVTNVTNVTVAPNASSNMTNETNGTTVPFVFKPPPLVPESKTNDTAPTPTPTPTPTATRTATRFIGLFSRGFELDETPDGFTGTLAEADRVLSKPFYECPIPRLIVQVEIGPMKPEQRINMERMRRAAQKDGVWEYKRIGLLDITPDTFPLTWPLLQDIAAAGAGGPVVNLDDAPPEYYPAMVDLVRVEYIANRGGAYFGNDMEPLNLDGIWNIRTQEGFYPSMLFSHEMSGYDDQFYNLKQANWHRKQDQLPIVDVSVPVPNMHSNNFFAAIPGHPTLKRMLSPESLAIVRSKLSALPNKYNVMVDPTYGLRYTDHVWVLPTQRFYPYFPTAGRLHCCNCVSEHQESCASEDNICGAGGCGECVDYSDESYAVNHFECTDHPRFAIVIETDADGEPLLLAPALTVNETTNEPLPPPEPQPEPVIEEVMEEVIDPETLKPMVNITVNNVTGEVTEEPVLRKVNVTVKPPASPVPINPVTHKPETVVYRRTEVNYEPTAWINEQKVYLESLELVRPANMIGPESKISYTWDPATKEFCKGFDGVCGDGKITPQMIHGEFMAAHAAAH